MKITVLQQNVVWNDVRGNLTKTSGAIDDNPGSDLYVLPEMFSTGFCTQPEGIAESSEGESLAWMRSKSSQIDAAIAGSVAVCENGKYYNRFYFVRPDGTYVKYDKKHLFTYGGEHKYFTAGSERIITEWRGVRILLEICYDLRFPIWSRNRGDYDMVIYVASWPTSRIGAWKALLTARAIENQCYVAGINRVGTDPSNEYCGATRVIDPYGNILSSCDDGVETAATSDIDMTVLRAFREKFPVLNDADYENFQ